MIYILYYFILQSSLEFLIPLPFHYAGGTRESGKRATPYIQKEITK